MMTSIRILRVTAMLTALAVWPQAIEHPPEGGQPFTVAKVTLTDDGLSPREIRVRPGRCDVLLTNYSRIRHTGFDLIEVRRGQAGNAPIETKIRDLVPLRNDKRSTVSFAAGPGEYLLALKAFPAIRFRLIVEAGR